MSERAGTEWAAQVEAAPARATWRATRLRWENRILLCAVCGLVFLVSLPRLQAIALQENELDAQRALELLARELESRSSAAAPAHDVAELCGADSPLRRRLGDLELMAEGRLALRHGYLIELARDEAGAPVLFAWPWKHGSSGRAAYQRRPGALLLGHPNTRADRSAFWSGLDRAPAGVAHATEGWRPCRLAQSRRESY